MKKIIVSAALLIAVAVQAQVSKIPMGKKIVLESTGKTSTKVSMMGQEMEIPMNLTIISELSAKSSESATLKTGVTLKKLSGSISMMGQETKFSSDDKDIANSPQAADLLKSLNKEEDVLLEDGKVKSKVSFSTNGVPTSSEFAIMVFLTIAAENVKEGYKWTEESNVDGTKSNTIYTVTKVTPSEIEMTASTSIKMESTIQQMGMDMKQNLTGTITSVRVYDATTAILKTDASKQEMTGTMLSNGMEVPVTFSTITTTTVK
ncbi:MAG: hypothetical protein QM541_09470 [Flavobacterium sp.]|nr:hypothetical protein [Flavobacterium sp.]